MSTRALHNLALGINCLTLACVLLNLALGGMGWLFVSVACMSFVFFAQGYRIGRDF